MKRGEIRWYHFPGTEDRRPVFILSRTSIIRYLSEVTVAPVTSTIREIPSEVKLSVNDGMPKDCVINFDHIQTVSKENIGELITELLDNAKINEVSEALSFTLGI